MKRNQVSIYKYYAWLRMLVFLLLMGILLTSCVNTLLTGARLAYNHNQIRRQLSDSNTHASVNQIIQAEQAQAPDSHIQSAVYHHVVLLYGQSKSRLIVKRIAKQIREKIKPTRLIIQVHIGKALSTLQKVKDAWITTKIKSKLFRANGLDHTKIKIITENGHVFLMGRLTARETHIAVSIVKHTDGVKRVIKVIQRVKVMI